MNVIMWVGPWFFCSFNSLTPSTLSLFLMSSTTCMEGAMVGLGGNNSQIFFKKILLYEMGLSYTWCNSKPLALSKSNSQKKALINANIPTSISLIVPCLLHSIRISKPNKRIHLTLSLSLSTFSVQAFVSPFVSVCCSSTIVPGCYQKKKKKKSH